LPSRQEGGRQRFVFLRRRFPSLSFKKRRKWYSLGLLATTDKPASYPGAGAGAKGGAVRPLKGYASWV